MCELSQFSYAEGSIVWVKLGSCWWPGEVKNVENLPEEILQTLKKKPFTAVKFFDEDKYEYVRNLNNICLYNNRRKNEFIRKGLDMARAKAKEGSSLMEKFPNDVITAECLTGGDPNILSKDAFAPQERPNYKEIFGDSPGKKKPKKNISPIKSYSERRSGRSQSNGQSKSWKELQIPSPVRATPKITHRRFISESDHEVRIRQQPCTPSKEDATSPLNTYKCHICGFTSSRLNVIVLHNKAQHSETAIATAKLQLSSSGKKRKNSIGRIASGSTASKQKIRNSEVKDTSKARAKRNILSESDKKVGAVEYAGEKSTSTVRKKGKANAKKKRETEVRESLLADWGEEDEEEEEKEIENLKLVLGSSRKLEEKSVIETDEEPSLIKKGSSEEQESIISEKSPKKSPEKSTETNDLEEVFKSLMDETTVPNMPEVPSLCSTLPSKQDDMDREASEESAESESARNENNNSSETNTEKNNEDGNSTNLENGKESTPLSSSPKSIAINNGEKISALKLQSTFDINVQEPENSSSSSPKTDVTAVSIATEHNASSQQNSITSQSQAPSDSQENLTILPIICESSKTDLTESMPVSLPTTSVVGLSDRTLVSAAPSEETTETATYVLVTIDDSGALQPIDNMNTVVNTALLALDGQQDDGPRTLYIDPSQLGSQGTDLENIFLAIDTRGDMTTQMVELTNKGSDQPEISSPTFSAAAAASAAKAKSAQDILAVALANTQVFQGDGSYMTLNPTATAVTVTSSRSAQAPVMTPRIVDPCRSTSVNAVPPISSSPTMSEIPDQHLGEVRPANLQTASLETPFHPQLQPAMQNIPSLPHVVHPTPTAVVTLPTTIPHLRSEESANHLNTPTASNIITLPSLIPSYADVDCGQTAATLTIISDANIIMDQVTQALPKVDQEGIVETSLDHVSEKRKLDCDVRESKHMRMDENGGS